MQEARKASRTRAYTAFADNALVNSKLCIMSTTFRKLRRMGESEMPRRRTTLGRGPLGTWVPVEQHAWEVLQRILTRGHPLTEDAVFLALFNVLRRKGSTIFQKVQVSKNTGGYRYFSFSPDIDLLEVRIDGTVVAYELKGYQGKPRSAKPPSFYDGIDQALAYLVNPIISPLSESFIGSIFDHVYVVHPVGSQIDRLKDLLERLTPLGLIVVDRERTNELVKPKPNPYLNTELRDYFLRQLDAFNKYTTYTVNPIQ